MISKRVRRPSMPQENLRQFSLNGSKGVNGTKAPNNSDTVYRANNLIVNPDGSLSLRKPIVSRKFYNTESGMFFAPLYIDGFVLTWTECEFNTEVRVLNLSTNVYESFKINYNTYTNEPVSIASADVFYVSNLTSPKVLNLGTNSILSNVYIQTSEFPNLANPKLYDTYEELPRYVQLKYDSASEKWIFNIKSPEVNRLNTAEGEIPLNPNLTLDNPYAIRDTYNATVPYCRGIVPYVATKEVNGDISYTEFATEVPVEYTTDVSLTGNPSGTAHSVTSETFNISEAVSCTITMDIFQKQYDTSNIKHTVVTLKATFTARCSSVSFNGTLSCESTLSAFDKNLSITSERLAGIDAGIEHTFYTSQFQAYNINSTDVITCSLTVNCTLAIKSLSSGISVSELTESSKNERFRPVVVFKQNTSPTAVLKAFCDIPSSKAYYAAWFESTDGIIWNPVEFNNTEHITAREVKALWEPSENVEFPSSEDYVSVKYYPFTAINELDDIVTTIGGDAVQNRLDVLLVPVHDSHANLSNAMYRFKIISVKEIDSDDLAYDPSVEGTQYKLYATVSQQEFTPTFGPEMEFLYSDIGNAVFGEKLYYKRAIYSYGSEKFNNNILVSGIDSFETPLYNIIDVDVNVSNEVTCLIPWRDYLVSATSNAIYLHSKQADGYLTKSVNTSIGIPKKDARCCKAILNGILFKSGSKVYQLYPNLYSGDDSTLNVTDISLPVEEYLLEYEDIKQSSFAFSTEAEYVLMLPKESETLCLRYSYAERIWSVCTYPVVFTDYNIVNLDDIRLYGTYDANFYEFQFDSDAEDYPYGDTIGSDTFPISFSLDTGYKADTIATPKQFVESKLMFATEDDIEAFPMQLTIAIDGDPHVTTVDINTDAPFWKTDRSVGVLGTNFALSSDSRGPRIPRQFITRYSGKGKAIRHILSGTPKSNFRFYEAYVRYKNLNTKR